MIVSIDTIKLPLIAELEFPQGLPRGQTVTLIVGNEDFGDIPKANDIRVDPLTKIVHVRRVDLPEGNRGNCELCSESFGNIDELVLHRSSCTARRYRHSKVEVNGLCLDLELNENNEKNVEIIVRHEMNKASLLQELTNFRSLVVCNWDCAPQAFYETCVHLGTKLLTRNVSTNEVALTIRSQVSVSPNRVKTTMLELEEQPEAMRSLQSVAVNFEEFCTSQAGTPKAPEEPDQLSDEEAIDNERITDGRSKRTAGKRRRRCSSALKREKESEDSNESEDRSADAENDKIHCLVCLKINRKLTFSNAAALETHMTNNHSVQVLEAPECSKCSKRFVSTEALQTHEKKCNPKYPKKCQVCSKSFAMGLHRDRHLREVHGIIKEHSCGFCGQKYQSEKHRDWHLVTKHKDSLSTEEMERLGMEEIQCTLCEFRTYSSKGMQVHRQKEHIENEKSFRCPACGLGDDSLAGIQEHIAQKHGAEDRWWVCQYCNRTFSRDNGEAINAHMENHTHSKGLTCEKCNKVFENASILADHTNRNHQENVYLYVCDICDLGSESYKELLKHMLKHNPFKKSLYKLQREHIVRRNIEEGVMTKKEKRTTTLEMHRCEQCPKQFELEATLTAHQIVTHLDPGKEFYRCPECSKAFKPHHLSYHLRLHSGERPHTCQYCDASFHTIASCSDHEIVKHTFAFKMWCPVCQKGFVSRAKTWQHLVRFHKETPEEADKLLPPITHKVLNILQKRRQTEEIKQLIENTEESIPSTSKRKSSVFLLRRENAHEAGSPEMEINDEELTVGDATVVDLKGFEESGEETLSEIPTEMAHLETGVYPQPELGPDFYRIVLPDGSQTSLRLEPGQQVLLEDEFGHQKLIELTPNNHEACG